MEKLYLQSCELLCRLGVTANYIGFSQMAYALQLCTEDRDRLLYVTKLVYPDVARHFHTDWRAVERNLRTVGRVIWRENQVLLEKLARKPLHHKPSTTQLLAILTLSHDLDGDWTGAISSQEADKIPPPVHLA